MLLSLPADSPPRAFAESMVVWGGGRQVEGSKALYSFMKTSISKEIKDMNSTLNHLDLINI